MVRGGNRGARSNLRGGIRGPFKKPFVPRHPFDLTLAEVVFPKVSQYAPDDTPLTTVSSYTSNWIYLNIITCFLFGQALLKRNTDLSPSPAEQTAIANLVSKVQGVLDNLVVAPGDFNTCVRIGFAYLI